MHVATSSATHRPSVALLRLLAGGVWFCSCFTAGCGFPVRVFASSTAAAAATQSSGPIVISRGGTYSGDWTSDDWHTPAVQIDTTEPVTLRNTTLSSRGDLISITRVGAGANVTIQNVTGTALDPGLAGVQRGSFVVADGIAALSVTHCTIIGARFGVKVLSSTPTTLRITNNVASHLEDRASDGAGGLTTNRPDLGHFVMLNEVAATSGAEISWNQFVNTIGEDSTEDVYNIYKSQGSPTDEISVHDNYIEGNASPAAVQYTGTGLIADGASGQPETAFVSFRNNQVVHTAGSGLEIASGHDITASGNRVVSCGVNSDGTWYAAPFVNAVVVWNYYGAPDFDKISVQATAGGVLRPNSDSSPVIADIWVRPGDLDSTDDVPAQAFTDPCYTGGTLHLSAEDNERAYWQTKLSRNHIVLGDQHANAGSH